MDADINLVTIQKIIEIASGLVLNYGFQLLGAFIILILGWFVAKRVSRLVSKLCQRANMDITLSKFFADVAQVPVLVFVGIIALGKFGITIAPLSLQSVLSLSAERLPC